MRMNRSMASLITVLFILRQISAQPFNATEYAPLSSNISDGEEPGTTTMATTTTTTTTIATVTGSNWTRLEWSDATPETHRQTSTPLYLGGLFSLPGGNWDGSSVLVAVEMALEHINENAAVLPGYELKMVWNNSMCDAGLGTRLFFEQLNNPPQKLMLIGPPCSSTAQIVGKTSFYWNLITMSYTASSSALSNRVAHPYFYRTYMPDILLNHARMRLIKEFGWKRVATIHENDDLFSSAVDNMLSLLQENDITIISSESFDEDPTNQVANLKRLDARIIIINMYETKVRRVMCEAGKLGMVGPGYAWLGIGWWSYRWWALDDDKVTKCTTSEVAEAVETSLYIGTEGVQLAPADSVAVSGITPLEFDQDMWRRMILPQYEGFTYEGVASYGYDAAWAIALALNKSAQTLKTMTFQDGSRRHLEDFTYDDEEMGRLLFDAMKETNFNGISGHVSFSGADRIAITQIDQLGVGCSVKWAHHDGRCFLFVEQLVAEDEARTFCQENENSRLATVEDQPVLDFLVGALRELTFAVNYTSWLIGTPSINGDNTSSECTVLDAASDVGTVYQVNCNIALPFICQEDDKYLELIAGYYDIISDKLTMEKEIVWPGGSVPLDRTPVIVIHRVERYEGISLAVFIAFTTLAVIGILVTFLFLCFNVWCRDLKVVRMSSPNLNNIILLGAVLIYSHVIVYGIDMNIVSEDYLLTLSHVRVWLLSVGFVLAFGAMFSKTWRVHKVVALKTPKRKVVQDRQLLAIVAVLLLIDVCILLPWQLIFPWREEKMYLPEQEDPRNSTVVYLPYIIRCNGDFFLQWSGVIIAFKGLLLLFGAFLAWETRQVRIPALNDSKLIGISVYNVVILCIVGLAINLALDQDPQTIYIFNSAIALFCTTLTLLIVFFPKVVSVYKAPDKDPMKESTNKPSLSNMSVDSNREVTIENMRLKKRIAELEKKHNQPSLDFDSGLETSDLPEQAVSDVDTTGIRSCNVGVWCCGVVCGCSVPKIVGQISRTAHYRQDELTHTSQSGHVNDVDLSLEFDI